MKTLKFCLIAFSFFMACESSTAQRLTDLKQGDQSPDFCYKDQNGKTYSLKDFKGKYVLIDFWASYCVPCKKETPYWKELIEKFKGRKIVFINISIDYDQVKWMEGIKNEGLDNLQLIIDRDNLSFTGAYRVETIPRYILLDKKGRVVNAYMPRPSDPEMLSILRTLKRL